MEKLGIEPRLLLAQIVNFAIIVFVLSKFLYKPILDMLEKRKNDIEKGLKMTEDMKEEEAKLSQKRQKMIEVTRKEASDILDEARKQAKEEEKDIIAQAHTDAEAILAKGKADAATARVDMEKSVEQSAIDLAVSISERLLTDVLSAEDKHKLIAKHIKELSSVKA